MTTIAPLYYIDGTDITEFEYSRDRAMSEYFYPTRRAALIELKARQEAITQAAMTRITEIERELANG